MSKHRLLILLIIASTISGITKPHKIIPHNVISDQQSLDQFVDISDKIRKNFILELMLEVIPYKG